MWKQWARSSGFGQSGAIFFLIGLFVSFSFLFCLFHIMDLCDNIEASCFRMMTNRVLEKEKKIRELMRMGGLRTGTETAAWWFTVLLISVGPIVGGVYILQVFFIYV